MTSNDNSVNIKAYHHGDLRSAVVDEGLRLLQEREADSLSLREIARNVGVSATALYRHFPDKGSLLVALATAGYAKLTSEQQSAVRATDGDAFAALGRAYVRFAVANPALFRLTFVKSPAYKDSFSHPPEGTSASLLEKSVRLMIGKDASDEEAFVVMLRAWSLVHGLAMLILDKQVLADDAMIDRVIAQSNLAIEFPL